MAEELQVESARIAERLEGEESLDLESAEFFVRGQMHQAGARVIEKFLAERLREEKPPLCANHHLLVPMHSAGLRERPVQTILGRIVLRRRRWVCPRCPTVRYATDEALGVSQTLYSPGMQRIMAHAGASQAFGHASEALALYGDLRVDPKEDERMAESVGERVEAWMAAEGARAAIQAGAKAPTVPVAPELLYGSLDGTGAPMRTSELQDIRGKGPDGKARTREVKLGCFFTQTRLDEKGRPVRDEASTTYVGAIESSRDFGHRMAQEGLRRGSHQAKQLVILTDGAGYNKTIVAEHFPTAIHILDLYHARDHLARFARSCAIPLGASWHRKTRRLLDKGRIKPFLAELQAMRPARGQTRKAAQTEIEYFRTNAERMRYDKFRKKGFFVGSGVIEAGCRTVVGQRLKHSGMFWTVRGANAIIALRCCILSGRFPDFWEAQAELAHRRVQLAA